MAVGGGRFLARGRRAQRVEVEARHGGEWERDTTQRRFDPLRGWPAYMANTRLPSYGEGLARATMEMAILPHKACSLCVVSVVDAVGDQTPVGRWLPSCARTLLLRKTDI